MVRVLPFLMATLIQSCVSPEGSLVGQLIKRDPGNNPQSYGGVGLGVRGRAESPARMELVCLTGSEKRWIILWVTSTMGTESIFPGASVIS